MNSAITRQIGTDVQAEMKAYLDRNEGDAESLVSPIAEQRTNEHSPIATSLANLVTTEAGHIDQRFAADLGKLFTFLADEVDSKRDLDHKEGRILELGTLLRLPDTNKSIRAWQQGDDFPLGGFDVAKKNNYFTLTVNEKKYTVEVKRNDQGEILDLASVGKFSMVELMAQRAGDHVFEKVTELLTQLEEK